MSMISDITIGQYYKGDSFVHKLDPRVKIILTILFVVMGWLLSVTAVSKKHLKLRHF